MAENKYTILHLRSSGVTGVDLYDVENYTYEGNRPEPDSLEYGELAVNYNSEDEVLMIKNDEGEIVAFINEKKFNNSIDSLVKAIISLDYKVDKVRDYDIESKIDEIVMPITTTIEDVTAEALVNLNNKIDNLINTIDGGSY